MAYVGHNNETQTFNNFSNSFRCEFRSETKWWPLFSGNTVFPLLCHTFIKLKLKCASVDVVVVQLLVWCSESHKMNVMVGWFLRFNQPVKANENHQHQHYDIVSIFHPVVWYHFKVLFYVGPQKKIQAIFFHISNVSSMRSTMSLLKKNAFAEIYFRSKSFFGFFFLQFPLI